MRLLYLNHNPAGTGTYQRASHLGRAMAGRGHDVTVVTTHPTRRFGFEVLEGGTEPGSYTEVRAPDLLPGPGRTGWDPSNVLRRVRRLRGDAFDLVHAFDSRPVVILPALDAVRRSNALFFLDWADWWGRGGRIQERSGWAVRTLFGPLETWFEEAFRGRAHGTTTISAALAERAAALGVDPSLTWVIPNGCDPDGLRPGDRSEARKALHLDSKTPLIVHAGVLTPADMEQLAGAFRLVTADLPEARLALVGNHTAPVPQGLLEGGRTRVTGFVAREELARWLAAADVCVVPLTDTRNNSGRWPGRLNDYLATGRATVMPRVGDAAALLEARGAGWVGPATPEGLARSLLDALSSPAALARAGERARALAEGDLAWPALAERLERAYNAVLAHRLGRGLAAGTPRRPSAALSATVPEET